MTDEHLSLDELAELDEGLLSSDRISAIRAHVHGCDSCRAKADAITTARSALSDLPPVAMPEDIRARIDEALAHEASRAADPSVPTDPDVELSVVDDAEPRVDDGPLIDSAAVAGSAAAAPSPRTSDVVPTSGTVIRGRFGRPTMAASAAAAAVVLGIGAIVVAHFHHGSSTPRGQVASGSSDNENPFLNHGTLQPSSLVKSSTGTTYTAANLSASVQKVLARSPATGPITPSATSSSGFGSAGGAAKPERSTKHPAAGTNANKATTPGPQAESSLLGEPNQPVPKVMRPLFRSNAKIIQCAVTLTNQKDAVPEHVDFGRWTGGDLHNAPSAIFIFQGLTPTTVAVWVVNPTCSGNDLIRTVSTVTLAN